MIIFKYYLRHKHQYCGIYISQLKKLILIDFKLSEYRKTIHTCLCKVIFVIVVPLPGLGSWEKRFSNCYMLEASDSNTNSYNFKEFSLIWYFLHVKISNSCTKLYNLQVPSYVLDILLNLYTWRKTLDLINDL